MAYYRDQEVLIDGALTIYRIEGSKKGWWYGYFKIGSNSRIRKSLKTTSRRDAIRLAHDEFNRLTALDSQDLPIRSTSFEDLILLYRSARRCGERVQGFHKMLFLYFGQFNDITEINADNIYQWEKWRIRFWTSKEGLRHIKRTGITGGRCLKSNISPRTLKSEAIALRSLLRFAFDRGLIPIIPDINILTNRYTGISDATHRRAAFTENHKARIFRFLNLEYTALLKRQQEKTTGYYHAKAAGRVYMAREINKNRRMWAWCHLLNASGLRPQEAKRLVWNDIQLKFDANQNLDVLEIHVRAEISKVKRRRVVYVIDFGTLTTGDTNLHSVLMRWKDVSPHTEPNDFVFCSVDRDADRSKPSDINLYFSRLIKRRFGKPDSIGANFEPLIKDDEGREYSSYSFRHLYATRMLLKGVQSHFLCDMMGTSEKQLFNFYYEASGEQLKERIFETHRHDIQRKSEISEIRAQRDAMRRSRAIDALKVD